MSPQWEEVKINNEDFRTHSHYVAFFAKITKDLEIELLRNFRSKIQKSSDILDKKTTLVELTHKSLKQEYKIIEQNPGFAIVASSWVAVKAYYLFFNLFLIIKYLIQMDVGVFNSTHKAIQSYLRKNIGSDFKFNKKRINQVHNLEDILNWHSSPGDNLKCDVGFEIRYYLLLKKLAKYRKKEFKRIRSIKRLAGENKKEFVGGGNINICEFFYIYRIKANYRDLEFLTKRISEEDLVDFYKNYFKLTENFYKALRKLINDVSKIRIKKELFK